MTAISKKKIWSTILKFFSEITSLSLTTGMLSDFDKKKNLVDDFEIFFQIN